MLTSPPRLLRPRAATARLRRLRPRPADQPRDLDNVSANAFSGDFVNPWRLRAVTSQKIAAESRTRHRLTGCEPSRGNSSPSHVDHRPTSPDRSRTSDVLSSVIGDVARRYGSGCPHGRRCRPHSAVAARRHARRDGPRIQDRSAAAPLGSRLAGVAVGRRRSRPELRRGHPCRGPLARSTGDSLDDGPAKRRVSRARSAMARRLVPPGRRHFPNAMATRRDRVATATS